MGSEHKAVSVSHGQMGGGNFLSVLRSQKDKA